MPIHVYMQASMHVCVRVCVCTCVCTCTRQNAVAGFSSPCQLVYDVQDGGGCFHLIAVNAESMSKEEREKYQIMGTELPPSQ